MPSAIGLAHRTSHQTQGHIMEDPNIVDHLENTLQASDKKLPKA